MDYVAEIREDLAYNLCTPDNPEGCLEGSVDDYIKEEDYDTLFDNLNAQFAKNDETLQK